MFEETEFVIENLQRQLIDIDITQSGSWVGITGYTATNRLQFGTHIHFGGESFELTNEIRNPLVRSINEKTVLVFGITKQYNEIDQNNSWIINLHGEVEVGFSTAGAVENVVTTKDFVAVAYFDEAACYGEGLEIYDFEGKFLFGYEGLFGEDAVEVMDCYSSTLISENQIIFSPYTEFPLVIFDLENKTQEIWETPADVHGSHAITKLGDKIYFHRPYRLELEGYDFGIYEWRIGDKEVRKIGEYQNHFTRGLPNGRFLARTDSGYTIISLQ